MCYFAVDVVIIVAPESVDLFGGGELIRTSVSSFEHRWVA